MKTWKQQTDHVKKMVLPVLSATVIDRTIRTPTLHDRPLSLLARHRERVEDALWDAIAPVRVRPHGHPRALQSKTLLPSLPKNSDCSSKGGRTRRVLDSWTFGVPRIQSLMWSQAALAADRELDCFRALITAAPRCCTVLTNSSLNLRFYTKSQSSQYIF